MSIFNKKPKYSIKAVQEQDLVSYLKSIGVLGLINSGQASCQFCGSQIILDTLEAVSPKDGKIVFICSNKNCINQI